MKKAKITIILLSVVFTVVSIINLIFSVRRGEPNAIYSILSDFFLAGLFILTIIIAYKRNDPADNKMILALMFILPVLFIIGGVLGITRL